MDTAQPDPAQLLSHPHSRLIAALLAERYGYNPDGELTGRPYHTDTAIAILDELRRAQFGRTRADDPDPAPPAPDIDKVRVWAMDIVRSFPRQGDTFADVLTEEADRLVTWRLNGTTNPALTAAVDAARTAVHQARTAVSQARRVAGGATFTTLAGTDPATVADWATDTLTTAPAPSPTPTAHDEMTP